MDSVEEGATKIRAQPFPERTDSNVWARCCDVRDRYYDSIAGASDRYGVDALIEKSLDFEFPAWVKLSAWLPVGDGATRRVSLTVTIVPMPHHDYEFEIAVQHIRGPRSGSKGVFHRLDDEQIDGWVRFVLVEGAKRPSISRHRLRRYRIDLWRPRNRVAGLGRDYVRWLTAVIAIVGLMLLGAADTGPPAIVPVGVLILLIAGGIVVYLQFRKRRRLEINVGKPVGEPRYRRLADSWHTLLIELGSDAEAIRRQLHEALTAAGMDKLRSRIEHVSYIGADGKQEREQLVLSYGRSIVFCHIYPYGEDLFVGWDAYVNFGEWVERRVADGYDWKLGRPVRINTVVPGLYSVTEYDLIDLDSLIEWTHARITRVVKRLLDEQRIDQEVDFKIVRGERRGLLDQDESAQRRNLARQGRSGGLAGGFIRRN